MRRYLLALLALLFSASFAYAQAPTKICIPTKTDGTNCVTIDANNPFPIIPGTGGTGALGPSGKDPLIGTFGANGTTTAFIPLAGRTFNISVWGTFSATVQLYRSFDGGTTKLPITGAGTTLYQWTATASEIWSESEYNVSYYLTCSSYVSGTVNYRISQ